MIMKHYGKILTAIILAGTLAMILTGCASQSSQANPAQTITEFATPDFQSQEEQYIAHIRSLGNMYIDNNTDQALIDIGGQVCTTLDSGYSVDEMVTALINSGTFSTTEQYEFAGIIVGAGVKYFCPEYITEVEAYLANN